MRTKRWSILLLAAVLLLAALSALAEGDAPKATASGTFGNGLTWKLSSGGTLTVSGAGAMPYISSSSRPWEEVVDSIKAVVIEPGVTSIASDAFRELPALKSVAIGPDVTTIGSSAFTQCRAMTKLTIGESVTEIKSMAFNNCDALKSLEIPASVQTIGFHAFSSCDALESLTLKNGIRELGYGAFAYGESLKQVILPNTLETIGDFVFQDNVALESATLKEGIAEIPQSAFSGCTALKRVTIPKSVKRVGYNAFNKCNALVTAKYAGTSADWDKVELGQSNTPLFNAINVDRPFHGTCGEKLTWSLSKRGVLTIRGKGDMDDYAKNPDPYRSGGITIRGTAPWCDYEYLVTSVVIKSGVTGIGDYAFSWFKAMEKLSIPDSVTRIGEYALYGIGVSSLKLPPKLKTLSRDMLGCTDELMYLEIPSGVKTIGRGAFSMAGLRSLVIPASVTMIEDYAFYDCDGLTYVHYAGTKSKWQKVSVGSIDNDPLKNAIMRYSTDRLKKAPSGKCGKKVTWKLSESGVLTISGTGAMDDYPIANKSGFSTDWYGYNRGYTATTPWREYLARIKKIVVKKGVTTIGEGAFFNCFNATSVSLPGTLTAIGQSAFRSMNITSITIPDGVKTIGAYAFFGCFQLTEVHLPKNLQTVTPGCFEYCQGLEKLVLPGKVTYISEEAFGFTGIIDLTIPASVKSVGRGMGFGGGTLWTIDLRFGGALPSGLPQSSLKRRNIYCPAKYYKSYRDYLVPWILQMAPSSYGDVYIGMISTSDTPAKLSAEKLTLTEETTSARLTASVGGVTEGLSVKWYSSDPDRVKVTQKGKVTAKAYSGGALVYAEVKYKGNTTLVFCPVTIQNSHADELMFKTLPTSGIKANYLATCAMTSVDEHENVSSYMPNLYVETDKTNQYYKELAALVKKLTKGCANNEQKARAILKWIGKNLTYSMSSVCLGENPSQVYSVYLRKEGNCQGFSKLAGFMFSLAKVPCGVVTNNGHMWNIAWMGKKWVMLDAQHGENAFNVDYFAADYSKIQHIIYAQGNTVYLITEPDRIVQVDVAAPDGKVAAAAEAIVLPAALTEIDSGAFAGLDVEAIAIPAGVTFIADDAFEGTDAMLIVAEGSYAQSWAEAHGMAYTVE